MAKIIKVIYSSPAIPQYPYDVEIGAIYECVQDKGEYSIKGKNFERVFNLEFIKRSFKPCEGYSWDMLNEKKEVENTSKPTKRTKANKTKDE
jgi:hypothetical protein